MRLVVRENLDVFLLWGLVRSFVRIFSTFGIDVSSRRLLINICFIINQVKLFSYFLLRKLILALLRNEGTANPIPILKIR